MDLPKKARLDLLTKMTLQKLVDTSRHCCRCKKHLPLTTPRDPVELPNGTAVCGECFFDDPRFAAALKLFNEMESDEVFHASDDNLDVLPRIIH